MPPLDTDTPTIDHAEASIAADWERIREGVKEEPVQPEAKAAPETPEVKEPVEKPADDTRDAKGRFKPKEAGLIAPNVQEPAEVDPAAVVVASEPEQTQPVESPKSLRKELADKHWGTLPPEIQAAWQERDANYERGIQRYKERAESMDRMEAVFAPYAQTLQQVNATPEQAVQTLLGMDHILRHGAPAEKAALLAQLANQFQVPLDHLPQVGPLQQQLLQQAQQLHAHQAQQSAAQAQQAQRELDTLTSEVVRFSEGKAHFATVSQEMFAVLPSITQQFPNATPQEKLQKAYDIAVNANPTARSAIEAQRQQEAQAEARKKAIEAKKAAATNRTPRGVVSAAPAVGSMEDTIRAKAAELGFA